MTQNVLPEDLRESARVEPNKTALISGRDRVTFSELDQQADRVAAGFHRLGIRKGDRVAFVLGNRPSFVALHYGVMRAGAISVPLSTRLRASDIRPYLGSVNPRAIVVDELVAGEVISAGPHAAPVFVVGKHPAARPLEDILLDTAPPDVQLAPDDIAVVAYTSGVAGDPKGAALSHRNLSASLDQMLQVPGATIEVTDIVYGVLPLVNLYALNIVLGMAIRRGATVVLEDRFEASASLQTIVDRRVSVIAATPPIYAAWAGVPTESVFDLSGVRLAVSGGSALPPRVHTAFRDRFGVEIWEGYGLTETASVVTTTLMSGQRPGMSGQRPGMGGQRPGSVGLPLPGQELRIVDEDGEEAVVGDPGEIWIRGPNVFRGYWGDEEATNAAFSEDWFRTGDIAYQDEDGYVWLVDRDEEVIVVSGFKVFPKEVERVLHMHDAVVDAAVIGEPDPRQGEKVKALVVLSQGSSVHESDLIVHCTRHLARFKVPALIEFAQKLPHYESGAVMRRALTQDSESH